LGDVLRGVEGEVGGNGAGQDSDGVGGGHAIEDRQFSVSIGGKVGEGDGEDASVLSRKKVFAMGVLGDSKRESGR
ncbi:hypothetical protein PFISCL1PPCAC_28198, partial [Pristionchus fissidentatus]